MEYKRKTYRPLKELHRIPILVVHCGVWVHENVIYHMWLLVAH